MNEDRDLLWTGGWDSTFRVVELLTQTDVVVRPHYIWNPDRTSAELEMQTMTTLRGLLAGSVADAESRLLPLAVTDLRDIPPSRRITDALAQLRSKSHLGLQYDYLARYASLVAGKPLELCIESGSIPVRLILDRVVRDTGTPRRGYRLEEREDALSEVFRWFDFPLAYCGKDQMREQARQWGMESLLIKDTWFCHKPWLGRYSCGTCRPCVYIMNDRETWRMGFPGRLRFTLIERPKRLVPASAKRWLRSRAGRHIRSFLRA